jgi:rhomboid protease GluP
MRCFASLASQSDPQSSDLGVDWERSLPATWGLVWVLVALHVGTAVYEWQSGLSGLWDGLIWERDTRFRVSVGGQHAGLVEVGEVWRLWTSVLLHVDGLHLLFNSVALISLGRILEPWIGSIRWLSWFILGGLSGSVASFFAGVVQSDGASGGAFALLAAAAVLGLRERHRLDAREALLMGPVLWGFLVLNLLIPLFLPFIDGIAHLGGAAMGVFLGVFVGLGGSDSLRYFDSGLVFVFGVACVVGWTLP